MKTRNINNDLQTKIRRLEYYFKFKLKIYILHA